MKNTLLPAAEEREDLLLYIVTHGRVSGRKHIVKIRFVRCDGKSVCVLAALGTKYPDWLSNLLSDDTSSSFLASKDLFGSITNVTVILDSNEAKDAVGRFIQKYGSTFVRDQQMYYRDARPMILEFKSEIRSRNLVAELEFDLQAKRYTALILDNPISTWQRQVTTNHLARLFNPGCTVLEIGSGTGVESIPLARYGVNIFASDISEEMLNVLDKRASNLGVEHRIRTRKLSSSEIGSLAEDPSFPAGGFDGAFSHFGALNLEPNLKIFSRDLSSILKPRSCVSFAVWNRICLTEVLANVLEGRTELSRERISGLVRATEESKYSLDAASYTPGEFASHFRTYFEVISYFAIPTLIPPSEYARKFSWLLKFRLADLAIGKLRMLRDIGDNFVITMRKVH